MIPYKLVLFGDNSYELIHPEKGPVKLKPLSRYAFKNATALVKKTEPFPDTISLVFIVAEALIDLNIFKHRWAANIIERYQGIPYALLLHCPNVNKTLREELQKHESFTNRAAQPILISKDNSAFFCRSSTSSFIYYPRPPSYHIHISTDTAGRIALATTDSYRYVLPYVGDHLRTRRFSAPALGIDEEPEFIHTWDELHELLPHIVLHPGGA